MVPSDLNDEESALEKACSRIGKNGSSAWDLKEWKRGTDRDRRWSGD